MAKVSIIIPAFNAEQYIQRCVNSLYNQTLSDIEIIIIDDGSTDNTYNLSIEYTKIDKRIKVFHQPNTGQASARNLGLIKATGVYVGFVDADDFVEVDMYEKLFSAVLEYDADWAYSYMESEEFLQLSLQNNITNGILLTSRNDMKLIKSLFLGGLPTDKNDSQLGMSVCRSIFKRKLILENNICFISERLINSEDLLFNIDVCQYCERFITVNQVFYHYCHDNPNSFSVSQNINRYNMFKKLYFELKKRSDTEEELLRCKRRFLANARVVLVEISRWTNIRNYLRQKKLVKSIVMDYELNDVLKSYPINQLPAMQKIYFYIIKLKVLTLIILIPKLRYKFF